MQKGLQSIYPSRVILPEATYSKFINLNRKCSLFQICLQIGNHKPFLEAHVIYAEKYKILSFKTDGLFVLINLLKQIGGWYYQLWEFADLRFRVADSEF